MSAGEKKWRVLLDFDRRLAVTKTHRLRVASSDCEVTEVCDLS